MVKLNPFKTIESERLRHAIDQRNYRARMKAKGLKPVVRYEPIVSTEPVKEALPIDILLDALKTLGVIV